MADMNMNGGSANQPKKNSARWILTASGVFDLLNLIAVFVVIGMLVSLIFSINSEIDAVGGSVKDGSVDGLSGFLFGMLGGFSVAIMVIFAVLCLIPAVGWLLSTILSFKTASAPIASAKRKTGGLITFIVLQYLVGFVFIIGGSAFRGDGGENQTFMIVTILLGVSMLLCATLKAVAVSKINKEQLPQQAFYPNNGQPYNAQQNNDQIYNWQQYGNPQNYNQQYGNPQNGSQQYGNPQNGNPQHHNPQYGNPRNYGQKADDINVVFPQMDDDEDN